MHTDTLRHERDSLVTSVRERRERTSTREECDAHSCCTYPAPCASAEVFDGQHGPLAPQLQCWAYVGHATTLHNYKQREATTVCDSTSGSAGGAALGCVATSPSHAVRRTQAPRACRCTSMPLPAGQRGGRIVVHGEHTQQRVRGGGLVLGLWCMAGLLVWSGRAGSAGQRAMDCGGTGERGERHGPTQIAPVRQWLPRT